jgi:hypothetical protein
MSSMTGKRSSLRLAVAVGTDGLLEAAAVLEGFPKDRSDTREVAFRAAGPEFAGGSACLKFYCKDGAGHTAFLAEIEGDYGEQKRAQCATVDVDFEPASLDRFLIELRQVESEHRGIAVLVTQEILTRSLKSRVSMSRSFTSRGFLFFFPSVLVSPVVLFWLFRMLFSTVFLFAL